MARDMLWGPFSSGPSKPKSWYLYMPRRLPRTEDRKSMFRETIDVQLPRENRSQRPGLPPARPLDEAERAQEADLERQVAELKRQLRVLNVCWFVVGALVDVES